jgi:cell fate (sporulation/competence/biofilm development) regulator YlbF (YheA/YmcA/DUF963 family)
VKKLNNLAKEINGMLLDDDTIKEYLKLKKEIKEDKNLSDLYNKLDKLRKEICKNKEQDSQEYYELLDIYNSDKRIIRYKSLKREVHEYLIEVSDILSLK